MEPEWSIPAVAEGQLGGSSEPLELGLAASGDNSELEELAGDDSFGRVQVLLRELGHHGSVAG